MAENLNTRSAAQNLKVEGKEGKWGGSRKEKQNIRRQKQDKKLKYEVISYIKKNLSFR